LADAREKRNVIKGQSVPQPIGGEDRELEL
jgi:hypothetical protein